MLLNFQIYKCFSFRLVRKAYPKFCQISTMESVIKNAVVHTLRSGWKKGIDKKGLLQKWFKCRTDISVPWGWIKSNMLLLKLSESRTYKMLWKSCRISRISKSLEQLLELIVVSDRQDRNRFIKIFNINSNLIWTAQK